MNCERQDNCLGFERILPHFDLGRGQRECGQSEDWEYPVGDYPANGVLFTRYVGTFPYHWRSVIAQVRRMMAQQGIEFSACKLSERVSPVRTTGGASFSLKKTTRYRDYLRSEAWQNRRRAFFKNSQRVISMRRKYGQIVCEFCKKPSKFNLHHKTYERLGNERSTDLIILCDDCHEAVHSCDAPSLKSATRRTRKARSI